MADIWFAILAVLLTAYAVLDGFDFGAGLLHLWLGRSDRERQTLLAAIGPYWDGNEVFLIASGGVLFVAFPAVLATAFPAFYLAFFVVLWAFALRGVAIEVRGHWGEPLWRTAWDTVYCGASALLALLFGVALGNVVRGLPLGTATSALAMPFFTNFWPRGEVGILDVYTLTVGLLAVAALGSHGATLLALRTVGELRSRSLVAERRLAGVAAGLFVVVTAATGWVRPDLFAQMAARPLAWLFALVAVVGAVVRWRGRQAQRDGMAFVGSCALLAGLLLAAAAGLHPVILHSTLDPAVSMTAEQGGTAPEGLQFALWWWPVAALLVVTYAVVVVRGNRQRVGEPAQPPQAD